ncbi:MAG: hypothetical protein GY862_04835 [Gammaproteobacteria bacterium]|nr:hypothetical protein [Gammaproteobacteria bacterium]
MTVEVFAVQGLMSDPDSLNRLMLDFKRWKETEWLPDYFGRDGDFSRHTGARMEELRHLHLDETGLWLSTQRQYSRTSDRWLIYCRGFYDPDKYLLIAIIEPDAHQKTRNALLLDALTNYGTDFRNKY